MSVFGPACLLLTTDNNFRISQSPRKSNSSGREPCGVGEGGALRCSERPHETRGAPQVELHNVPRGRGPWKASEGHSREGRIGPSTVAGRARCIFLHPIATPCNPPRAKCALLLAAASSSQAEGRRFETGLALQSSCSKSRTWRAGCTSFGDSSCFNSRASTRDGVLASEAGLRSLRLNPDQPPAPGRTTTTWLSTVNSTIT